MRFTRRILFKIIAQDARRDIDLQPMMLFWIWYYMYVYKCVNKFGFVGILLTFSYSIKYLVPW